MFVAAMLLGGCNLAHIRDYSIASSKTMGEKSVANAFPKVTERLSKTTGRPASAAEGKESKS